MTQKLQKQPSTQAEKDAQAQLNREQVSLKLGYSTNSTTVKIHRMHSRMGLATESYFTNLNTKIIERKQDIKAFDPAKVLNPALRAQTNPEDDMTKGDFLKIKKLFTGEQAKNLLRSKQKDAKLNPKQQLQQNAQAAAIANMQASLMDQTRASQQSIPDMKPLDVRGSQTDIPGSRKSTTILKPSQTMNNSKVEMKRSTSQFLVRAREPYTYIKKAEAPPPNHYRPNFVSRDKHEQQTEFYARKDKGYPEHIIHTSSKPVPTCLQVCPQECNLASRKFIRQQARPHTAIIGRESKSGGFGVANAKTDAVGGDKLFITGVDQNQPDKLWWGGGAEKDEREHVGTSDRGDSAGANFPKYVENKRKDGLQGPFKKQKDTKPEQFKTMISRGLTFSDMRETEVIAANVFIGNKPLWHPTLDEKRFDNIDKDPEILTRTKVPHQPKWALFSSREIEFKSKVYNRNTYLPSQKQVTKREGISIKNIKKQYGRDDQRSNSYYTAQQGSASHVDSMRLKTAEKKTKIYANYKTCGIVSMNQQKPRDNSMYLLSDCTNLTKQDKALKGRTDKYGVFNHTVLTRQERKESKSQIREQCHSRSKDKRMGKEQAIDDIWSSFTVPVKFKVPARKSRA